MLQAGHATGQWDSMVVLEMDGLSSCCCTDVLCVCCQLAEALEHMPALLVLDDLDALCPTPSQDPSQLPPPPGAEMLLQWLCDVLDALRPPDALPYPGDCLLEHLP